MGRSRDPRAALRWALWKLRPLVDERTTVRLVANRERVGFEAHGAQIDLPEVRAALAGGIAATATESLVTAADAFRGELLEGLELDDCLRWHQWYLGEREALRATHAAILDALVERLRQRPEDALRYARVRVELDPLGEEGHFAIIQLSMALGRERDALGHSTRRTSGSPRPS